jgi:hypothetical protein
MIQDLEAQREYARCHSLGIGFSARPDMWLYKMDSHHYVVREPRTHRIIHEVEDENLGINWLEELERRARR